MRDDVASPQKHAAEGKGERVRPSNQPPLSFTLPADLIQSCSVLAGLLSMGAMVCGTLLVLYLWTRCGRWAGRSPGKSRTTACGAPGLLVELAALLAGMDALQPGAGDFTLHVPPCSFILQTSHLKRRQRTPGHHQRHRQPRS